uniref:Carrier domain-containing protein n=1 Tax=Heterorhabditis bacteriophora TaxID=37862 RepID=A0A1I7X5K9_HETBA
MIRSITTKPSSYKWRTAVVVQYWEAHGTGTPIGDPIEVNALSSIFEDIVVSSVKASVGHGEASAATCGLLKLFLMFQNDYIPANIHLHKVNNNIDCKSLRFPIVGEEVNLSVGGISSFGVSGTNAAAILQKSEIVQKVPQPFQRHYLILLSAKNQKSLLILEKEMKEIFKQSSESINEIVGALCNHRIHYEQRYIAVINRKGELIKKSIGRSKKNEDRKVVINLMEYDLSFDLLQIQTISDHFNSMKSYPILPNHKLIYALLKFLHNVFGQDVIDVRPKSPRALILTLLASGSLELSSTTSQLITSVTTENVEKELLGFAITPMSNWTFQLALDYFNNILPLISVDEISISYGGNCLSLSDHRSLLFVLGSITEQSSSITSFQNQLSEIRHAELFRGFPIDIGTVLELVNATIQVQDNYTMFSMNSIDDLQYAVVDSTNEPSPYRCLAAVIITLMNGVVSLNFVESFSMLEKIFYIFRKDVENGILFEVHSLDKVVLRLTFAGVKNDKSENVVTIPNITKDISNLNHSTAIKTKPLEETEIIEKVRIAFDDNNNSGIMVRDDQLEIGFMELDDQSFMDLGMDSISLVDFVNQLNRNYFPLIELSTSDIFNHPTTNSLSQYIYTQINSQHIKSSSVDRTVSHTRNDSLREPLNGFEDHSDYRIAFAVSSPSEAVTNLMKVTKPLSAEELDNSNLCFFFSPQGVQYGNMEKCSLSEENVFKRELYRLIDIASSMFKCNFMDIMYPQDEKSELIMQANYAQVVIFILCRAVIAQLEEWGLSSDLLIGHSVGEYAAATYCGIIDEIECMKLLKVRGELIANTTPAKMLAIWGQGLNFPEEVEISAVLSDSLHCIVGSKSSIESLKKYLDIQKIEYKELESKYGFHSSMMDSIQTQFHGEVISTLSTDYCSHHMRHSVRLDKCIDSILRDQSIKVIVQIGPSGILENILAEKKSNIKVINTVLSKRQAAQNANKCQLLQALADLWSLGFDNICSDVLRQSNAKLMVISLSSDPLHWMVLGPIREYHIGRKKRNCFVDNRVRVSIAKIVSSLIETTHEVVLVTPHCMMVQDYSESIMKTELLFGRNVIIFGGTGSIGKTYFDVILEDPKVENIVICSRTANKNRGGILKKRTSYI